MRFGVFATIALIGLHPGARAESATAWTVRDGDGAWTVVTATNHASSATISNTTAAFFECYRRIGSLLGVAPTAMPRKVEVLFSPDLPAGVPAHTAGNRLTVSAHHASRFPEDLRGLLVHEWTHAIQAYPDPAPVWITEGIADAVRVQLSPADDPWRRRIESAPRAQTDYRRGYGDAARFLLWIQQESSPGFVARLNDAMRQRTYTPDWWTRETQATLDEWWSRYRSAN